MLIASKIERKNGTKVKLAGVDYHFRPRKPDGEHVDEVANPAHIQHFLAITEGYAPARVDESQTATEALPARTIAHRGFTETTPPLSEPDDDFAGLTTEATGLTITAGEETATVSLTADDFNVPSTPVAPAEASAQKPVTLQEPTAPAAPTEATGELTAEIVDAMDEVALRANYEKLNGRAAPANATEDTLKKRVLEMANAG